jgi:2-haloacid dehalogenase
VKPDPAIYRLALDRFGVRADETVFVDDNPANIAAARALEIESVLFTDAASFRSRLIELGLPIAATGETPPR